MGEPCYGRNLLNLIVLAAFSEIKGNSSCGSHAKLDVLVYGLIDGLQLRVEDWVSVYLACAIAFK